MNNTISTTTVTSANNAIDSEVSNIATKLETFRGEIESFSTGWDSESATKVHKQLNICLQNLDNIKNSLKNINIRINNYNVSTQKADSGQ